MTEEAGTRALKLPFLKALIPMDFNNEEMREGRESRAVISSKP